MVFTNTLVTAHAHARRVQEHPLCAAVAQFSHADVGVLLHCNTFFLKKSQCALFVVSLFELHSAVDLDVFCQNV